MSTLRLSLSGIYGRLRSHRSRRSQYIMVSGSRPSSYGSDVVVGSVVVAPVHRGWSHDSSQPAGQSVLHGQASLQAKNSRLHVDVQV